MLEDKPDYDEKQQLKGFDLSLRSSGVEKVVGKYKNVSVLNITRAKKLKSVIVRKKLTEKFGANSSVFFPEFLKMIPKEFQSDSIFFSLSKIKSHKFMDTKITNCLKNQYGLISDADKTIYHKKLSEAILCINMVSSSLFDCYYITEALRYTMEAGGPTKGDTIKNLGLAVAGKDPVEIDAIAATLMEVDPEKLDYLQLCRNVLGNYNRGELEKIPNIFKRRFKLHPDIDRLTRGDKLYQ